MIKTKTKLLQHQKDAYNKLIKLKVGALYMGMGTGKTRTAIELIKDRLEAGKVDKVLWFCPCTVRQNLREDIEDHADGFLDFTKIVGIESISMSDRTYLECLDYVSQNRCFLVVDESNLVKNHLALRTRRIQALAEVCTYKLILNGTPITRNAVDLYAQWYILDKRIFGYRSYWSFAENHIELDEYGKLLRVLNVGYLTDKIAPYTFEISKDKCLDLPAKRLPYKFRFSFSPSQEWHYNVMLNHLTSLVDEWNEATIYRLLTAMQLISSGRRITGISPIEHVPLFDKPEDNPRLDMLDYVLRLIGDEKVIVWCKYHFEIDEVKYLLEQNKTEYRELHGGVTSKIKMKGLRDFKHDPNVKVLIGVKSSGGYGLNLQHCNQMVYYSSDFDWGTTIQSEDRIHRYGQTRECEYYYILADAGIDDMIISCLENKEELESNIRSMLHTKNCKELLQ